MILNGTKGCAVTRKGVGGEEHFKISSARKEFKLFQKLGQAYSMTDG